MKRAIGWMLAVLAAGVCWAAAAPEPWAATVAKLSSEDFAMRQAGQRELAAAGVDDRAALSRLAAASADAEVKARVLQRVSELDQAALVTPGRISLAVKDATLGEVAAALGKATGMTIAQAGADARRRYSLAATGAPFWEVVEQLSAQGGFAFDGGSTIALRAAAHGVTPGFLSGPVTVYVDPSAARDGTKRTPGTWRLGLTVAVDPRVRVVGYCDPEVASAIDGRGVELARLTDAKTKPPWRAPVGRQTAFSTSIHLTGGMESRTLALVKGTARLQVIAGIERSEKGTVSDIAAKLNTATQVADGVMMFTRAGEEKGALRVDGQFIHMGRQLSDQPSPCIYVVLEDASGQRLAETKVDPGAFSLRAPGIGKAGTKIVVETATKVQQLDVPFALKDIPMWAEAE